jgi:hypothetical protein
MRRSPSPCAVVARREQRLATRGHTASARVSQAIPCTSMSGTLIPSNEIVHPAAPLSKSDEAVVDSRRECGLPACRLAGRPLPVSHLDRSASQAKRARPWRPGEPVSQTNNMSPVSVLTRETSPQLTERSNGTLRPPQLRCDARCAACADVPWEAT